MADLTVDQASALVQDDIAYWLGNSFMPPELLADKVCFWVATAVNARLAQLTSEPALAAFREAWGQADAEGAKGDRVRRGMAAANRGGVVMGGHAKDEQAALRAHPAVDCTCGSCSRDLEEYGGRIHALVDRGLDRGLANELWQAGNESLVAELEAATDADLAAASVVWSVGEWRKKWDQANSGCTPPRPTCPACGKVYHAISEEIMPKVRRLCEMPADDREDGKRYRRYEPCGHVVEVEE